MENGIYLKYLHIYELWWVDESAAAAAPHYIERNEII